MNFRTTYTHISGDDWEKVVGLIDRGADINNRSDSEQQSPLHKAAFKGAQFSICAFMHCLGNKFVDFHCR